MVVFTLVAISLANPRSGFAHRFYESKPARLTSRLRWLWYGLAVGAPLLLAVLALFGYLYTAATLTGRIIETIWLILAILVLNLVVLRWLSLARRKILLQRALEARAARRAEKEKAGSEEAPVAEAEGEGPPVVESKPMDLDAVDQQTRRLLQSSLFVLGALIGWGIWSEVLPALGILEDVSLWTETVTIDGSETQVPITLADILLGLVAAVVTWVASRNLPGLLEIAVLRHLELQPGGRYTIITLVRYIVVTVGIITVLNIIGWSWSRIQWLVAALSVGLGFGLQEIVANFVSGLIILFERPVRVGDTVTVGNLTGTVSKVRIRATTITDWDRKEIIVPNKAFITDQVVNWTLSDPITRITIDVGISYGSDVTLAHHVIEETLRKQPLILDEPEPRVYFMGFGDSSLNFRLYVYARELSDRLPLTSIVHHDIFKALKDNGIEIPFPQRDLHVRSISPGVRWEVDGTPDDKPE
jgi:potassium efflux system protein